MRKRLPHASMGMVCIQVLHSVQQCHCAGYMQILAVFTAAAPIVYAGGLLYSVITDSPIQLGLLKVRCSVYIWLNAFHLLGDSGL